MVWACFDFFGKSKIIVIDGSINSLKYQKILENHMLPLFRSRAVNILFSNKTMQDLMFPAQL